MATVETREPSSFSRRAVARPEPSTTRDLLLIGLAFASGAFDAIAILGMKVFTAFMTGNLVYLGLGVAGAEAPDLVRVAVSLAAFAGGVFVAVQIVKPTKGSTIWPKRVSIALGVAALAQAAFATGWLVTSGHPSTGVGDLLIACSALSFGVQSGAVMSLDVKGVFTTAATATVIMLAGDEAGWSRSRPEKLRLAGVLVSLVAGAAAGGFLLLHARAFAPVLPVVATLSVVGAGSFWLQPARTAGGGAGA